MTPMPVDLLIKLRDTFAAGFTEEELRDLTLAMGIDYENISGSTKSAKARELATYLWRRSMLPRLAEAGPALFPDIKWKEVLGEYWPGGAGIPEELDPVPEPAAKLNGADLNKVVRVLADYPMFQTPGGRKTVLTLSGVDAITNIDLNGSARDVASMLAVHLNEFGKTGEGDFALGRLMSWICMDGALPPADKDSLTTIAAKYGISL